MHKSTITFGVLITLLVATTGSCVRNRSELEWKELVPIFNQNNLTASEPLERHKNVTEIEAVDSKLYGPVRGTTRGKRVYALTTDASISTYLEPPKRLKKAIELLPEI